MRPEKKFLVQEVSEYLGKSDYVYFANFVGVTVAKISSLRKDLRDDGAECHVVKNSILKVALDGMGCAPLDEKCFEGHTAIITGGSDPSGVAKILFKFAKSNEEKMAIKGGVLSKNQFTIEEIRALSELPSLEVLRAQVLALFNTPAQQLVRVLNAVPQGVVNVLQAKLRRSE
ncbi:MAG: 50S ribosomal protein L10 [Puniceicoccales bacterium]|jgi:large subunit ribosomal protein L10|nr:50S ribosomal protein L10 [Puniceicoccales bacterium]